MTSPERGEPRTWQYLAFWADGAMDLSNTQMNLPGSDMHAADLIAGEWAGGLHYAKGSATWHIWDGKCHRPDDSGEIEKIALAFGARFRLMLEAAKGTVRSQVEDAPAVDGKPANTEAAFKRAWESWLSSERYAAKLLANAGQAALAGMLARMAGCADSDLNERHPDDMNCLTGTIDLRTAKEREHDPADMITYCVPAAYRPELTRQPQWGCPRFGALVYRLAGGDGEVAEYILRVLGYSLIGANPEMEVFFLNGPTKSGKSQVLYIVRQLLGVLGYESKSDLITYTQHGRNARSEHSIRGRRLVTIAETSNRMHVEEGQLKRLTGEREIAMDEHYAKDRVNVPVTWLIINATNDMPAVSSMDSAMRERMVVIPCGPTIPAEERDKFLAEKILNEEAEAVFALLVHYASRYYTEGLPKPEAVRAASERFCSGEEDVPGFVKDTLILVPPTHWRQGYPPYIGMAEAYKVYLAWYSGNKAGALTAPQFHDQMSRVPGITKVDNDSSVRRYVGCTWSPDATRMYGA